MESRERREIVNMKMSVLKVRHFEALQCCPDIIPQLIVQTAALFIRFCRELHGLSFEKKNSIVYVTSGTKY